MVTIKKSIEVNKVIAITLILMSFFVSAYSSSGSVIPTMFILIIVSAIATMLASIWYEGEFKEKAKKASKITIPLTFVVFLLGYLFETLKVMF